MNGINQELKIARNTYLHLGGHVADYVVATFASVPALILKVEVTVRVGIPTCRNPLTYHACLSSHQDEFAESSHRRWPLYFFLSPNRYFSHIGHLLDLAGIINQSSILTLSF